MADNNIIKFRRIQKKPDKKPEPPRQAGAQGTKMSTGRLSLIAWALIVAVAAAIVFVQQAGLFGR
jgi:hypothetical protein